MEKNTLARLNAAMADLKELLPDHRCRTQKATEELLDETTMRSQIEAELNSKGHLGPCFEAETLRQTSALASELKDLERLMGSACNSLPLT